MPAAPAKKSREEQDAQKRKILFVPCESKRALHNWIKVFLGLDIPDCIVDSESTSSPMDMLYETYERARNNDDPDFNRVLYFASRDSFKTLGAAILEVLSVVHLGRDVAHMAAIESQASKAQRYVKGFCSKPFLRDFVEGDNSRETWIVRYRHEETKESLTTDEWEALPSIEKNQYVETRNFIKIIICTMQGTNSEHVPLFVVDEVDVVRDVRAYEEAKMIPAPINGLMPITLLTSTRKFSTGMVQREIDDAQKSGLQIRHWNLIDCTEACPPERHLPEEPKIPIYVSEDALRAVSEDTFNGLAEDEQKKYVKEEGYTGCLKNCKIFAACKGALATKQTSKSKLLKPIAHTQNQFGTVSLATAKAQLLCRKPSTEGLIYPSFERSIHMLTPAQMAEKITGEPFDPNLTRQQLLNVMKHWELKWYAGMDFGYTHNFAVVTGAADGYRLFIVDVIAEPELEPSQQVDRCRQRIKPLEPNIFADPENPQMVKVLRKAGFRMREWKKLAGSVIGGIDVVRMKLQPGVGEPQLFLLSGDEGCELLAKRITQYHWKLDAAGRISDTPDDEDDDECDALRYLCLNVFGTKGKVQAAKNKTETPKDQTSIGQSNFMKKVLAEALAEGDGPAGGKGKRGSFGWDIG